MGLKVVYGPTFDSDNGEPISRSWKVVLDHLDKANGRSVVVAWGFGRRRDADIAKAVLPQTGIDWDCDDVNEIRRQYISFGRHEAIKKFVCEHLQW